MTHHCVEDIITAAQDVAREGALYELMGQLLARGPSSPFAGASNRETEVRRAMHAVEATLKSVTRFVDPKKGDAGHGPGHWCRDFIHALRLAYDPDMHPGDIVPCIVGGVLHDIGTLFIDRYADSARAVRHAEVGALIVRAALMDEANVLSQEEIDGVAYGIAAHTNYLKPMDVRCADGDVRQVRTFVDAHGDRPIMSVQLPRWVDRLDCNGPCFPGRHYLTLARDHADHGTDGFYSVTFTGHMRPLSRTPEEIRADGGRKTMVEHLQMFLRSQSNESVYGKYDKGVMVCLRDEYRASLEHIIGRVLHPTDVSEERMLTAWTRFLCSNIEPSVRGRTTANDLVSMFLTLDEDTRRSWACGFRAVMTEYLAWSDRTLSFLKDLPPVYLRFFGVFPDVRQVIRPDRSWVEMLGT